RSRPGHLARLRNRVLGGSNVLLDSLTKAELEAADFEVTQPRTPCLKLTMRMGKADAAKVMLQSGKTGFYLRIGTRRL
ncbi:MAG: hypothetical protein OET44_21665, partial [Gammaproteobacteria bacterium]|nr:hypothetical protein [Gammaproteobacteria bacterium]